MIKYPHVRLFLVGALLVASLLACGADPSTPADAADVLAEGMCCEDFAELMGPTTPEAFLQAVVATLCAEGTRCLLPQAHAQCSPTAPAAWVAASLPTYEAAIAVGDLVFDGSKTRACLDALTDPTCTFANWISLFDAPGCVDVLVGQVPEGGACSTHVVCAGRPDTYCSIAASCPGVCARKLTVGQPCEYGTLCAAGLTCGDGGCKPVVSAGAGEACDDENGPYCSVFLLCAKDDAGARACRTYLENSTADVGEPCSPSEVSCKPGLSCGLREGAAPWCVERVAAGAPCSNAIPDMCPSGYRCSATVGVDRTCVPLPNVGEPCQGQYTETDGCQSPALCVEGTCQPGLKNGAACQTATQCLSGACVEDSCVPRDLCSNEK